MKTIQRLALITFSLVTLILPASADEVKVGVKAPDFELINQDGKTVKLSDYAGKNLVLAFSRAHW